MQASINNNKKINCSINCNQNVNCSMGSTNNIQANTCAQNDINANSTQRGPQGIPGEAATIQLGSVTTGAAGTDVIITNSGTENAAIFNFTIPRGDRGEQGEQGIQGEQGETGNGIASVELTSTSGLVDTYTITFTDGNTTTFNVTNGQDGSGASSISELTDVDLTGLTDGDVLVYDSTSQEWKAEAQSGGGGDGTIIIKEGTTEKGRFTLNQTGDTTINLTQVGAGMITFMQDGKQSGRMSANRATDMTITLKGLYDYESVNADMIGDNLEQANNNRVTGFSTNDYIVMREPITLPQYWEYDVDFSIYDTAESIGDEQYIFSDVNNTFALKENEDTQLYETFTLYVNGTPVASDIEAESAYYNIKFIKGMDENYNIVGSGNTLQCYVYVGYSSGQSAQKELVGSFTASTAPTTVQTIFGVNSNHAKPLSDGSYIDFTKCFIDEITRSGNTVTKTRVWDGLVKTINTKVNTWDLDSYVKSVNNELPDANGNVDVKGLYDYYTIDANIVGTPTISDNTVSDFTSSNYVQMGDTISIPSHFWEFQVKFTTGDTVPTAGGEFQYITSNLANTTQYGIDIFLDGANPNKISFTIGSVSSGVDVTISPNTTYTVKVVTGFTNEYAYDMNAHLYVYDEAGTLLNSWSGSPSVTPSDLYMKFGTDGSNNFDGSIDFENTYINSIELSTATLTGTPTREWTGIIPIIDAKADYNQLDGQWVKKDQVIASNVSFATGGSETKTYSLASYLPNDGATYEVLFSIGGQTAATSGSAFSFILSTDIVSNVFMCRSIARSAAYVFSYGNAIVPLTTRQIKVTQANNTSGTPTMSSLRMCGYRRVGTNS